MVYFVSHGREMQYVVYPELLDGPEQGGFDGIPYEQDPDTLDLRAIEREFLAKGRSAMGLGYRVAGNLAPKKVLWPGGRIALPDIIQYNYLACCPRFRDLVEQFEPGVHQFFPVDIYKKRSDAPVATYFWLNVCNRIDSLGCVDKFR